MIQLKVSWREKRDQKLKGKGENKTATTFHKIL